MSGGTTISNVQPAAGNLRVQSSVYGAAIPLVYGRARISGNLIWYGGFTAIPHTSTQSGRGSSRRAQRTIHSEPSVGSPNPAPPAPSSPPSLAIERRNAGVG